MAELGTSMPGPMADFGATPEARALRIRAGVLLPFWQDRLLRETGEDDDADMRRDVYTARVISTSSLLFFPDAPFFEGTVEILETWARFVEDPPAEQDEDERAAAEEAELIRQALVGRDKRPAPGSADQFLRGAFAAWLKGRKEGEELLLVVDDEAADVRIATGAKCAGTFLTVDEIPAQARVAGAKAVRAAFKEIRS